MVTTEQIKAGVRSKSAMQTLETTTVAQLTEVLQIDNFRVVNSGAGKTYVHFENTASGDFITAGIGPKVTDAVENTADLGNLFKKYLIYTGESANGRWFTFGPEPTSKAPIVNVSAVDLLAAMKVQNLKQIA